MEVSVNEGSGLQRQVTVTVPAERVNQELDQRLSQLAKNVKLPGFRPGKVPLSVVESKYRDEVYGEVLNALVSETYSSALEEHSLNPVAQPDLQPGELQRGQDFSYTATFDVYPEIEPTGYKGLELEKKTAEVADSDIDDTIERLRQMRADFQEVERAAAEGDQVVVDFIGRIDGEAFEGGEASDYPMELGEGRHLKEMEEGLVGASAGETRTIDVPFPEDYPNEELAGKTAQFEVTVKQVREKALPEVNEEFIKGFGVEDGSLETLRSDIREGLEREVSERGREELRRQIFEKLGEANDFQVPEQLVERQIDRLVESQKNQYRQQGLDPDTLGLDSDAMREQFRENAANQVKIGLTIPEIASAEEIETTQDEVREELERMADQYGSQRDQFMQYVAQNQEQMQEVEGRALETKVIDWIVENAQVNEENVPVSTLLGWDEESGDGEGQ
ncbi:trigger factor [Thiohalorhabdus methylotrophus]|uniref:Trigger factor n=1 Tax=Thiohalorhabdus methylotrophus TaxID=3242694 RepID=A0ABV4TVK7_9GAMM